MYIICHTHTRTVYTCKHTNTHTHTQIHSGPGSGIRPPSRTGRSLDKRGSAHELKRPASRSGRLSRSCQPSPAVRCVCVCVCTIFFILLPTQSRQQSHWYEGCVQSIVRETEARSQSVQRGYDEIICKGLMVLLILLGGGGGGGGWIEFNIVTPQVACRVDQSHQGIIQLIRK